MPRDNTNLARAAAVRDDEFYTRRVDIEREMATYPGGFDGATIHCPCDDPDASQFYAHFRDRFHDLGLRRVIATGLSVADGSPAGREFDGTAERDLALKSGSFASTEVRAIMGSATVVVTNPPFSMFRAFFATIAEQRVRFCVMGPLHAMKYKAVLPMIMRGECWMGGTTPHHCVFDRPGGGVQRLGNVGWFTNMEHTRRAQVFPLTQSYDPHRFPRYTNADGINIDRAADIPRDFAGTMGVPLSFLEKLNPLQFDIVGFKQAPTIGKRNVFNRLLIRHRRPAGSATVVGAATLLW